MVLLCLLLMSQLSVLVEVSGQNTTALNEMVQPAKGDIAPGQNTTAWNEMVDSEKRGITPEGTQIDEDSEELEDDDDSAVEGSAGGGVEEGRKKGSEEKNIMTVGTIVIVCAVTGLAVLIILVGVVWSCRKQSIERGEYTPTPRAVDDESTAVQLAQP